MKKLRPFLSECSGASAAEFAMVLPLVLLFLFGIIDVGRYGWEINRAEKATQTGARFAVVTDLVASGIDTYDYVGKTVGGKTLAQGDTIPADSFLVSCTSTTCTSSDLPSGMSVAKAGGTPSPFDRVVTRMQQIDPTIQAGNVTIEYTASGLGYAGDPDGMDIAPLTTVKLSGMQFSPLTLLLFGASVPLPSFAYALTMEDGSGTVSN